MSWGGLVVEPVVCRGCWQFGNNCKTCPRCLASRPVVTNGDLSKFTHGNTQGVAPDSAYPVGWDERDARI